MLFKRSSISDKKERILTVLDIGSSKVACFIARIKPKDASKQLLGRSSDIEILGYGVCRSIGIKGGIISNMAEAETSIKFAVSEAEKAANIEVKSILVGINSARIKSRNIFVNIDLDGKAVDYLLLSKLMQKVRPNAKETILHCLPVEYRLDESLAIENPIGMIGNNLKAKLQLLSIDFSALQNLELCLQRCYLDVEGVVAAPFASALAVLLEQEMAVGGICIDIGAATTSCAAFVKNRLIYATTVPCGSNHITLDLERSLGLSFEKAEKLKCLEGFLDANIKEKNLTSVITARGEEILILIDKSLKAVAANFIKGKTIVLTGGGSYLGAYTDLAEKIFKTKVRLGRPLGFTNIQSLPNSAAYSTALGLLAYPEYVEQNNFTVLAAVQKCFSFRNCFLALGKKINRMIY